MPRVFIGIGANIDPQANIIHALALLGEQVRVEGVSTFYRTAPLGCPEQAPFLNGVVEINTELPPLVLKDRLHGIEAALGRCRTADKYASRPIDLDILVYNEVVMQEGGLVIPDPEIPRRAFLAVPLCELAPELVLPDSGRKIADIAVKFSDHGMEPMLKFTDQLRREMHDGLPEG